MAFSVTTIRARLVNRLKDITDVTNPVLYQMATDLNQFLYNVMFEADPERFVTTTSYTVSSTPSTQALPAGYRDNNEYGLGFFLQNTDGTASTHQLGLTSYGSTSRGYYITGTNVVFTGFNTSTVIVLRYIPVLADIDDVADTFVVPDENKELVQEGLVLYYYRYNEDPREGEQEARFMRLLDLFKDGLPKAPNVKILPSAFNAGPLDINGMPRI